PTPNRRISITGGTPSGRAVAGRLAALALATDVLLADRRLWSGDPRAGEVALPRELVLVRLEQRRVAPEPRPGHRAHAAEQDHQDDREVELEDRADDQQEEGDQPGPEDPFPHVHVQAVAVERPRPQDVEHDQDDQQHGRGHPDRIEQVGEVDLVEPDPEVFPGQQLQDSPWLDGRSATVEYAMRPRLYSAAAHESPLG